MLKQILISLSILTSLSIQADDLLSDKLQDIHGQITSDYENVNHLSAEQLSLMDRDSVVLFDVRKNNEFDVSHINGAIQIDPDLPAEKFIEIYGDRVNGKTAVFYCSVGRRSSKFTSAVNDLPQSDVATAIYNLTGGLFHWHNISKPLTNLNGLTEAIHPYNFYWGRLIENRSHISYKPDRNERDDNDSSSPTN